MSGTKGTKLIKIDGEKLRASVEKRGLKQTDVSRGIGWEGSYISHCVARNTITAASMRMLEVLYDIKPEEYEYREPEPVKDTFNCVQNELFVAKEEYIQSDEFWKTLRMVIKSAVYEAVSQTYNEPFKKNTEDGYAGD